MFAPGPRPVVTTLRRPPRGRCAAALAALAAAAVAFALTGCGTGAEDRVSRAAVRSWTARRGGRLTVATSLWRERRGAVGFGGAAAERLLRLPGARPWTPADFGGSRGARFEAPGGATRALSFAVGRTGLFVRGTGAVTEADVLRTMERLVVSAQGEDIS